MQADGKMLLGGPFLFIGPTARMRVARLDVDGNLDPTFGDPSVNSEVKAIAVQPDGKILIGGGFDHVGGQPRHYLARLNDDGTTPASRIPRSMARSGRSRCRSRSPRLAGWCRHSAPDPAGMSGVELPHYRQTAQG